jgi:hypothetical protein
MTAIIKKIKRKISTTIKPATTQKKKTAGRKKTRLKTIVDNTLISVMMGASLSGGEFIGDKTAECFLKCKKKKPKEYPIRKHKKIIDEAIKQKDLRQKKM